MSIAKNSLEKKIVVKELGCEHLKQVFNIFGNIFGGKGRDI